MVISPALIFSTDVDYHVSFTADKIAKGAAQCNYASWPADVSDEVGISVFAKNESGEVFHTYSCYARGIEMLNGVYHYLDPVPKGRDEDGFDFTMHGCAGTINIEAWMPGGALVDFPRAGYPGGFKVTQAILYLAQGLPALT